MRSWRRRLATVEDLFGILFPDSQIVKESFLEDINNILNTGEVPNLFDDNELNSVTSSIRPIAHAASLPLSKAALYALFVKRVRRNIHMALCMSPLGAAFGARQKALFGHASAVITLFREGLGWNCAALIVYKLRLAALLFLCWLA